MLMALTAEAVEVIQTYYLLSWCQWHYLAASNRTRLSNWSWTDSNRK